MSQETSYLPTWDKTTVGVERTCAVLGDLPIVLDDTMRATERDKVAQMLYLVTQGQGRGRGTRTGLDRTSGWRTVMLSSGEVPITSFSKDGGTRMRTIEVRGNPFGTTDDKQVEEQVLRLNEEVLRNYGSAGPAFVAWLLRNRDRWPEFKKRWKSSRTKFVKLAGGGDMGRLAHYAAAIDVAGELAHEALRFPWKYKSPVERLWLDWVCEAKDPAGEAKALAYIRSWAVSHRDTFWRKGSKKTPAGGWSGRWDGDDHDLCLLPHILDQALKEGGFEKEAVLPGWRRRGWLVCDPGRQQKKIRMGRSSTNMVVIRAKALRSVTRG